MISQRELISNACRRLAAAGVRVSLFIDADQAQIDAAVSCGAPAIEIHTGHYADAENAEQQQILLQQIADSANYASAAGLQVNAGHGLNTENLLPIAALPEVVELNIGHAIVCDALTHGLAATVKKYKQLMSKARQAAA